jgi:hypothetical protein
MTSLGLRQNNLGEGGGQAIAAALREIRALTGLDLGDNSLGEGGVSDVRQSWGSREVHCC